MYGIADLDNCYCSCEKVFRPDLEGKPIVVLSNNDGCVVARSNEAKAMGIKEGTPYFQLALRTQVSNYAACDVLGRIFRQGYQYKTMVSTNRPMVSTNRPMVSTNRQAGVIVMGIGPDSPIQQDLFDVNAEQIQKMRRLDEVVDRINRMHGSEIIVIGAQQYTRKDGKGKADVFARWYSPLFLQKVWLFQIKVVYLHIIYDV